IVEAVLAEMVLPALAQPALLLFEAVPPVGEECARDNRGVVRPVLKQEPVLLDQLGEMLLTIGLVAREQDMMVRALDRIDRIDLDEAKSRNGLVEPRLSPLSVRGFGKPVPGDEEAACLLVGDELLHGPVVAFGMYSFHPKCGRRSIGEPEAC